MEQVNGVTSALLEHTIACNLVRWHGQKQSITGISTTVLKYVFYFMSDIQWACASECACPHIHDTCRRLNINEYFTDKKAMSLDFLL
jgi:hypothetical protein